MPPSSSNPPSLVYDGDCRFCRQWVARWQKTTGDRVQYESYQTAAWRYPEVSECEFAQSIQYFEEGKGRRHGADAVFHALAWSGGWNKLPAFLYDKIFLFAAVSEFFYRLVARNRKFFSLLTQGIFGDDVSRPEFAVGMRIFIKGLALIYLLAFVSYLIQFPGLVGSQGILPASQFFDVVGQMPGKFWLAPSLCWWWGGMGDVSLNLLCGAGCVLSLLVLFGITEALALFGVYVIYLSLCTAGQIFYLFQWDALLLEAGFVAAIGASWKVWTGGRAGESSRIAHFLILWLLFRLIFSSGMVKWLEGSKEWSDWSALEFHYFTQPLPTPLAWWAQQLPDWFQHASVGMMFFVEIFLPFLLFTPARLRLIAVIGMIALQLIIAATGNYGLFNFLTILLCLASLEDRWWPVWVRQQLGGAGSALRLPRPILATVCAVFLILGLGSMDWAGGICKRFFPAYAALRPLQLVNGYGLFVQMTTSRREIQLEGSRDGFLWKSYVFRYKPDSLSRPPPWVAPYMPRLDWMMWFAALGTVEQNRWVIPFMEQILRGSPQVLALLGPNPFPNDPPRYLRAPVDHYEFTTLAERQATGDWWKSQPLGYYISKVRLK